MLRIHHFTILHQDQPLGIDEAPYFSWKLESDRQNVLQRAFRLRVSEESGKTVWDSSRQETERSTYVVYAGEPLQSRTIYTVHVTVWDNQGEQAEAETRFETAFMDKADWRSAWVKSPFPVSERGPHLGEQPEAVFFRREMQLKAAPVRARLYASCHGAYQLTLNGSRPDDRELAPEFTVYRSYLSYQVYDVTALLHEGTNVLGMLVGDGWYHGYMSKTVDEAYDPALAAIFQLELQYADGSAETVCSDASVHVAKSPVLCSDLFAGERYDANREIPGWDRPGFSEDERWEKAVVADWGYDNLTAQFGQPVRPVLTLPVREVLTAPNGEQILDFGQVIAGRVRMCVHEPKNAKVVITCTEGLDEHGNFFDNNPTADQRIEYISGGEPAVYEGHFTFQGFRYIRVEGVTQLRAEDYTAVVLSTEKDNAGSFCCSDERLNRLYENTRWSQRANMISIPTDCPQREKAGWLGDIQVYTRTAMLNEDLTPFLTRWLRNMTLEQKPNGSLPMVTPLAGAYVGQYMMQEQQGQCPGAAAPAGWSDAAVLVPWYIYQITGNTVLLQEQYETMKRWCDFVLTTARENRPADSTLPDEIEQYLWNTGYHYGEHLIPSFSKNGYGPETFEAIRQSTKYVAPIYGWYSVSTFAVIANLLGKEEDAAFYSASADKIKDAIQKGVIGPKGEMPADLMGAYAMPLYFGLVPEALKETFEKNLLRKLSESEGCLDTGFLGTPVLQDVLVRMGRPDLAYDLLFQTKAPSWLYEVEHGATTIWESWFAMDEDGKPFVSQMGEYTFTMSLNHYAFGCVDDWMFRSITGIDSIGPGFKRIRIAPLLDERISSAERCFESEYGTIRSAWERQDDASIRLDVVIPCNTTAEVSLPDGTVRELGSGSYSFVC